MDPQARRPGLRKARPAPLVQLRRTLLARATDPLWRELFQRADVVSEGAAREDSPGGPRTWYGSTSVILPLEDPEEGSGGARGEALAALAARDVNVRLRAVRTACREATLRAPGPLGKTTCEIRVERVSRGLRIDVDVQAPLIEWAARATRPARSREPLRDEMTTTTDRRGDGGGKRKGKQPLGTVIHVAFGKGGGRIPESAARPPAGKADGAPPPPQALAAGLHSAKNPREPVTDVFTRREVAKLLDVSETRLRSLDRAGIVSPSGERSGKRAYTFQDLIALRATRELLAHKVKLKDVARAIGALRGTLPRVTRPLQELRIVSDGQKVVVRTDGGAFEAVTGQLVMDFQVTALRDDVVRVLRPETSHARAKTAYDLYVQASAIDEKAATFDEAEALYRRAIALDPGLAIAYTNLGNIRFRRGDEPGAEALYRRALEIDDAQPEAHYNLGYVMLERGGAADAAAYFERALSADPRFADAHFNLAMAYEQLGERAKARPHWKRYLELEPTGTWAEIARQHL